MDLADSIFLAAALHAGFLLVSAWTIPALGETDSDLDRDDQRVFELYPIPPAEPTGPDEVEPPEPTPGDGGPDHRLRSESRCDHQRGGSMGEPAAADAGHRYGVQGPHDNPDPHIARVAQSAETSESMIGLSAAGWGGDPNAPTAAWGRDDSLGNDAVSARGNMWGDDIGLSFGSPGSGSGLKTLCPSCGDDGRGAEIPSSDTTLGGATGTERAH